MAPLQVKHILSAGFSFSNGKSQQAHQLMSLVKQSAQTILVIPCLSMTGIELNDIVGL